MTRARHVLSGQRLPVDNAALAIAVTGLVGVAALVGLMTFVLPPRGNAGGPQLPAITPRTSSPEPEITARQGLAGADLPSPSPSRSPTASRTVKPPSRSPRPTTTSYEAESVLNTVSGVTRQHDLPEASGGVVVGNIGRGADNTLTMNGIFVDTAGTYRVTIFYVSGETRLMDISVNDVSLGELSFASTGDFRTVGTLVVPLQLREGSNTIEFGNPTGPAPDVDRLVVPG